AQGGFKGRNAVLALPAASMFIQHLRLPKMDEEAMKKALPWEARGKIPIDPSHALLRHYIAGTVYQEQEERNEVIVMAAGRDVVNQYLEAATKAKLEIEGMSVEPTAIVDCFSHIYRRKTDADVTSCYVDIGCTGSRAIIARGNHILFARTIPIGGDHLTQAVAAALGIGFEEAKLLRLQMGATQTSASEAAPRQEITPQPEPSSAPAAEGFALLDAALAAAQKADGPAEDRRAPATAERSAVTPEAVSTTPNIADRTVQAEQACREPLNKLVTELDLCRRYYESTFANQPLNRLIFIGGEAKHKTLCQYIAKEMGLAAQVGDPLVRMGRMSNVGLESGIDRRQPQPNWAVAIGLSLGTNAQAQQVSKAA
ncbi:MAG TPA: pilus assembly protein PilM, partial [Tepidisphaeraceae bacterium]|nr:pilus assembly protein PilM [Tepidisphaeraceae bacterium]